MKTWNELLQLPWHKAFIEIGMPKKEVRKLRREMAALVKQQKELKEEIVKKHGSIENFQKIFPDLINQASKLPIKEDIEAKAAAYDSLKEMAEDLRSQGGTSGQ